MKGKTSIEQESDYISSLNRAEVLIDKSNKQEINKAEELELSSLFDEIVAYEKEHYPI
ncbi:hypothetical protein [Aliivibrio fischeri]|uniref:hypothetical protein n=1 Tax=Aliivibrio fischeri TaxID=668 RepID=UPI000A5BE5A2|nr:hypothetical protein [Aliivibrio fischeri]